MPYSFTHIEREKTSHIRLVFLFLVLFYFVMSWTLLLTARFVFYMMVYEYTRSPLTSHRQLSNWPLFNAWETLFVFFFAVIVALFHWDITARNLIAKILKVLNANPINVKIPSHQQYQHILEELSVATGGETFEGCIIPSSAINSFSLSDFDGRQVIGVTEGVLSKLKRPQIEAVVGHEAAHILNGDALTTTLTTSLFHLYAEILEQVKWNLENTDEEYVGFFRGGILGSFLLYLLASGMKTLGQLLNMFISREREFRADAVAVRLTRDPLSLAEALYLASHSWRGAGIRGEGLGSLFLISPRYSKIEESYGLLSDWLATHPPVEQRLSILLEMAHTDMAAMEELLLKKSWFLYDFLKGAQKLQEEKWLLRKEGQWLGPYTLEGITSLDWVRPQTLVKQMGKTVILTAGTDEILKMAVKKDLKESEKQRYCPLCYAFLKPIPYEGVEILKCDTCQGILVKENHVQHILETKEEQFTQDIIHMAKIIKEEKRLAKDIEKKGLYTDYALICPHCQNYDQKMVRKFYSQGYHVEVDQCISCRRLWFDKHELAVLQCLYENDKKISPPNL